MAHVPRMQSSEEYTPNRVTLETFLPDFSGFMSTDWSLLLFEPRWQTARILADAEEDNSTLGTEDFLTLLDGCSDRAKQRSEVAKEFCAFFCIRLALRVGFPLGITFNRYDPKTDQIIVNVPLTTVRNILDRCEMKRHRSLEGIVPADFEPLWESLHELGFPHGHVMNCLQKLDPETVSTILRAFTPPRVEKAALRYTARHTQSAFSSSVDWSRLHSAKDAWHQMLAERSLKTLSVH